MYNNIQPYLPRKRQSPPVITVTESQLNELLGETNTTHPACEADEKLKKENLELKEQIKKLNEDYQKKINDLEKELKYKIDASKLPVVVSPPVII